MTVIVAAALAVAVGACGGGAVTDPTGTTAGPGGDPDAVPATTGWPPAVELAAQKETDLEKAANAAGCELLEPKNEGGEHISDLTQRVEYKTNPPTSGTHYLQWPEDGAYLTAPLPEQTVHTLEHGRIDIQWNPETAPDEVVASLKALFDEDPYHLLLFPNQTGMTYEVAATAWDNALVCETASPEAYDAIRAFRDQFVDKGPELVP
jgi:hypothetical protein